MSNGLVGRPSDNHVPPRTDGSSRDSASRAPRLVFVDLAPRPGGSIVSLRLLAGGLDRSRWCVEAAILNRSNPAGELFRSLDLFRSGVFTLGSRQGQGDEYPELVEEVRNSTTFNVLRRVPVFVSFWQSGGMVVRLARDILPQAWRLRRLIANVKPDLLHLNDIIPVSRAGIIAGRSLGLPIVCHVRALEPLTWLDRALSHLVNGYVFISQAVADQQQGSGAVVRTGRVVYNGVNLEAFPPDLDGAALRQALGIPQDAFVVGSLGRLVTWKGHHVALRAFAELANVCPQAHLLIVGTVDVAEPGYEAYLHELAIDLGIAQRVTFAGHRQDVPQVLAALDVLCHCAIAPEPFGRVLIEAMAARRPVIGSAAGGVLEIIEPGVNGLLAPPGNSSAVAAQLETLWRDPQRAQSLAAAGRRSVEQNFTQAQYVAGVAAVYEQVL